MASLLEKFRAQYPEGCLSADLVSVSDGQYIVRAVVSNQGVPLGTGLAASADVQVAEDKARERAIALLGLSSNAPETQSDNLSKQAPIETSKSNGHQDAKTETSSAVETQRSAPVAAISAPEEVSVTLEVPEVEPDPADDSGPPLDAIAEEPQQPSAATIALESFDSSPNPVNLSDIIAQTDVELMRLGWTNAQGREYLQKTYGKRSRTQLTDEELMTFLLYLEEQT